MGVKPDVVVSWWDHTPTSIKLLLISAVITGGAGNFMGLTQDTSDRYHASTAAQDFALRDARIRDLERAFSLHLEHSARYTAIIERQKLDIQEIHNELEDHLRSRKQHGPSD